MFAFRTKTVVSRKNKKAYVAYLGLLIALSSLICVFIPGFQDYIPWVFGTGVVVVVIGAFIAKGDITDYGLSEEDLVVNTNGISVGGQYYPMNQVRDLDFNVEGFAGMHVDDNAMPVGASSDGMTNQLLFKVDGRKITVGFYLESGMHARQLGAVFEELYERHIPFIERNKSNRTYLFQYLSPEELQEFKKKYGYV